MLSRRTFMAAATGGAALSFSAAARASQPAAAKLAPPLDWRDAATWGVDGKGWAQTARFYDRLPARAEALVPKAVWDLSRHASGMSVEFETDAPAIHVRYRLGSAALAAPQATATGMSGLDLYALDADRWLWAAIFKPTTQLCEGPLIEDVDPGQRRWRIYLPLHNVVESLEIGLPAGAAFAPIPPRSAKPVVFYGTSILHGTSASRPGMAWPSIVGRRLDKPTLNLGFSGNGKMEPALATLLAEIDAAAYVIDCAPNMSPNQISERAVPLVEILRAARPAVPIVLVEDRPYGYAWLKSGPRERNAQNANALRAAFEALRDRGVPGLSYVASAQLLGADFSEAMTDGSHPSDLGMTRYADALNPILQAALQPA